MASIFGGASQFTISGGIFSVHQNHHSTSAFDKLSTAAAHSALHDAPARTDTSRCHQHTRTNVLDRLERWTQGVSDQQACIFWLHGGAGAGKSAIMQTLAERCVAQQLVLGSFFFSRSDPTRNTAEVLVPTLLYQVAQILPSAMDVLTPIIDRDPLVFKKSLRVQLALLLVPTFQHLVQLGQIKDSPRSPRVFLVDGLDECSDTTQQQAFIQMIAALCHDHDIPVKFLIASRSEFAISTSFEMYERDHPLLGTIPLSEDADAEADIRRFIEATFVKICTMHPFRQMIPWTWPDQYDINRLVWKSSSHFIYASTAMNYIWSTQENPVRSLDVVLGLQASRTTSPFAELDSLYLHILMSAAHLDKVKQILAHCLFSSLPSKVGVICIMLECSVEDLSVFLADMGSLVVVSNSGPSMIYDPDGRVQLLHQSFGDFLADESRCPLLNITREAYLASTLERCFQVLNLCSLNEFTSPDWPATSWVLDLGNLYYELKTQILNAVYSTLHTAETQQLLSVYTLRNFHECQSALSLLHNWRIQDEFHKESFDNDLDAHHVSGDLVLYLQYLKSTGIHDNGSLLRNCLEDFFDVLESHINLESKPLAPAILPLLFSGYPPLGVCNILALCCVTNSANPFCNVVEFGPLNINEEVSLGSDAMSFLLLHGSMVAPPWHPSNDNMEYITPGDLASIRHSFNASPVSLKEAVEAIFRYLPSILPWNVLASRRGASQTPHKTWLQRKKPGKHVSTGNPKLASKFHRRCLATDNYRQTGDHFKKGQKYNWYLRRIGLPAATSRSDWPTRMQQDMLYTELMQALIWLLPNASYSELVILRSGKAFSPEIYHCNPELCRQVQSSLDNYFTRAQDERLRSLSECIDEGNIDALIEKSQMLHLNAQD